MRTIYIYVEGKNDLIFVCQFLKAILSYDFKLDLKFWKANFTDSKALALQVQTITPKEGEGGIDARKISALIKEIKTVNSPKGIESVLLIDADTENHNHPKGGFQSRNEYLANLKKEAEFKYFIVPTHEENGNLESILEHIICDNGKDFYACLNEYISSLLKLTGDSRPQYIIENPNLTKEKIGWYIYMMEGRSKKHLSGLQNSGLWNFTTEKLEPLKKFMLEHLDNN
jgi:hypothetical protein